MSRLRTVYKFILGGVFGFLLVALALVNILLAWVATGPRDLSAYTPYIESALNAPDSPYRVAIGKSVLLWDGWRNPLDIRLRDVKVYTGEDQLFAAFPSISLGLDILSLLQAKVRPASLVIRKPVISLFQDEAGAISFGFKPGKEEEAQAQPAEGTLAQAPLQGLGVLLAEGEGAFGTLHSVEIIGASLSVGNTRDGVFLTAQPANVALHRKHNEIELEINAGIAAAEPNTQKAEVRGEWKWNRARKLIDGRIQLKHFSPALIAPLLPNYPALTAVRLPLSGVVDMVVDEYGIPQRGDMVLAAGMGYIESPMLEAPWRITNAQLAISVMKPGVLHVQQLTAAINGAVFKAGGDVEWREGDMAVKAQVSLGPVMVNDVRFLWPKVLAPISRDWVTENITEGQIPLAKMNINIGFGDLAKPSLPPESIQAEVPFSHTKIHYMAGHPALMDAEGIIYVNAKSLDGRIKNARFMSATSVGEGRVFIANLEEDNPQIEIALDAQAAAGDIARFLALPKLELADALNIDPESVQGKVYGHADLAFYYFLPRGADGKPISDTPPLTMKIEARLEQVGVKQLLRRFDIVDASGMMKIDDDHLTFKGRAVSANAPAEVELTHYFSSKEGVDTELNIKSGRVEVNSLTKLGYPAPPGLQGAFGLDAVIVQGKQIDRKKLAVDLTQAQLSLPWAGYVKPTGQQATLMLAAETKGDAVAIHDIDFAAKDTQVTGTATVTADFSDIRALDFPKLVLGGTNAAVHYREIEGGHKLSVTGQRLDLTAYLKQGNDEFRFSAIGALDVNFQLKELVMHEGEPLRALNAQAQCNPSHCERVMMDALVGKAQTPFTFAINTRRGGRDLRAESADAGAVLRVLGINEGIEGGVLRLSGEFADSQPGRPLKGRLLIHDYTVHDAPLLARLLRLISPTGLIDILEGNGITFKKLQAPFRLSGDVITLSEAKAYGSTVGLTAEGTIRFPGKMLDINGTIVPSYAINSVLGNVPLVGELLTGGEGQGVFAANYTMKGKGADAEVNVNPLSMLTPGFLRGLFDVFDDKEPDADAEKIENAPKNTLKR